MITVDDISQQRTAIDETFSAQHKTALAWRSSTAKERINRLRRISRFLGDQKHIDRLCAALAHDLSKSRTEAMTSEIMVALHSLKHIMRELPDWMRSRRVPTAMAFTGTSSKVVHEPKGRSLIIAPWNYPFQLAINPIVYAIAAGCTVVLKPSEYSVATAHFLQDMLHQLFDKSEVRVFTGGVETAQHLLDQPFDHIYFTGSPTVGKIVMRSAAAHLSSITLELGGKSPCIIDHKLKPSKMADRIVWGKFYNNGQTCIAPDHLYVDPAQVNDTVEALNHSVIKLYGPLDQLPSNPDYGRIISDRHYERAIDLLQDATNRGAHVAFGGGHQAKERYIEPTLLTNVDPSSKIMQEEIFAPILPILTYDNDVTCIEAINSRPKPLALYLLSKRQSWIDQFIQETSAGTTVINDFLIQYAHQNLPFGGINHSGIGKSHGKSGFLAFTNQRSVMHQHLGVTRLLHPPYGRGKEKLAAWMSRWLG